MDSLHHGARMGAPRTHSKDHMHPITKIQQSAPPRRPTLPVGLDKRFGAGYTAGRAAAIRDEQRDAYPASFSGVTRRARALLKTSRHAMRDTAAFRRGFHYGYQRGLKD